MAILGIDTSNYTTSIAVVDRKGKILCDLREVLKVPIGQNGLRQSEAFFQHSQNLPKLINKLKQLDIIQQLEAIAVSKSPRNSEKSYMPVFMAGTNIAAILSDAMSLPIHFCSHQEGHIYAGMFPSNLQPPFIALHLSGGTTDLLNVQAEDDFRLKINQLGSSSDLHCGQFIDRIGVKLGLTFPCGQAMEKMAMQCKSPQKGLIPSVVKGGEASFSGPLTKATGLLSEGSVSANELSYNVFHTVAKTAEKMIRYGVGQTNLNKVLLVGGVASNKQIRAWLKHRLRLKLYFANAELSRDNGVGVALMGLKALE
ncbi:O-sialoglycoprotein endopeptidase [Proteinivorax tanatarense]|uniref:N(6)-L-threonylcarbamoyladenine synthase n=1 Tax=Proteinivorax tanatarense TaxID=1260629 RepID=A0AAU7VPR4_9FIRM